MLHDDHFEAKMDIGRKWRLLETGWNGKCLMHMHFKHLCTYGYYCFLLKRHLCLRTWWAFTVLQDIFMTIFFTFKHWLQVVSHYVYLCRNSYEFDLDFARVTYTYIYICIYIYIYIYIYIQTPWPESASKLFWPPLVGEVSANFCA
jgi:hypothetical protein